MIKMRMKGAWKAAMNDLRTARTRFPRAIDKSVAQEAQMARKMIIDGIREQAPAGKRFLPLSRLTVALRRSQGFRGSKALTRTGALIGNIAAKRQGRGRYFVGVLRGATTRTGTAITTIARMNEEGATFVVRVTPRMRRYLMAALRQAGKSRARPGTGALKRGIMVVRIPARPFIGPVIDVINSQRAETRRRMIGRVAKELGYTLGR